MSEPRPDDIRSRSVFRLYEVAKYVTDPGEQVEFVIAMGNWMSFSLLFRNLRIPLADGIAIMQRNRQRNR